MIKNSHRYDLHVHSSFSDGDLLPEQVVAIAQQRGLRGVSLTDHNGIWGIAAAQRAAATAGMRLLAGIEITALFGTTDVHILGYSRGFAADVLEAGLSTTREGYERRMRQMIAQCHAIGYTKVSFANVAAMRAHQTAPSYISYDVAKQLTQHHGLTVEEARRLTVRGGACYVPYGSWALSPQAVINLLHLANGVAVLAHPGTIVYEAGEEELDRLLVELVSVGLDGIEVQHPFHSYALKEKLTMYVQKNNLLATAGSDWHGPGRYHDEEFGRVGLNEAEFMALVARLPRVKQK